jgi:steroid delta-isomerase-like uncharacterized protein
LSSGFLESVKEALESLDAEKLVSHYAEDAVFLDPCLGQDWSIRTRDELKAYFQELFALSGAKFEVTSVFGCDPYAAAEWTWSGNKRGSHTRFSVKGASVIQIRDGKIARETIYCDPRPAL